VSFGALLLRAEADNGEFKQEDELVCQFLCYRA
jgi:hypothetical protein